MIELASFDAEVRSLHAFFERWYSGEADPAEFVRLDVLADSFVMIGPDGRTRAADQVREMVRASYGTRRIEFAIRNVALRSDSPVGTYEEWQTADGATTGRLSTVVMAPAAHLPNGLAWLHLHETWLPDRRP